MVEVPRALTLTAAVRARLREKTASHCVSVAELMVHLAGKVGVAVEQAFYAGLLHDLGKALKGDELIEAALRYGIAITEVQRAKPKLLHAPVGAEQVKREFGIDDPEVYDAIYWHPTGRPGYGRLGQLLYFADFAEPLRIHREAEEARALLERKGFDAALWYVVCRKLDYVRTRPPVDPTTEAFHAWLRPRPH